MDNPKRIPHLKLASIFFEQENYNMAWRVIGHYNPDEASSDYEDIMELKKKLREKLDNK